MFDVGLLMKALEMTLANPTELVGVIPLEAGMHLVLHVISAIGYAGLKNLQQEVYR